MITIKSSSKLTVKSTQVCYLINGREKGAYPAALKSYSSYLDRKKKEKNNQILRFHEGDHHHVAALIRLNPKGDQNAQRESMRRLGNDLCKKFEAEKASEIWVSNDHNAVNDDFFLAILEGMMLGSYRFDKYKSDKKKDHIKTIHVVGKVPKAAAIKEMYNLCKSAIVARDLVNEPVIHLNSVQLRKEIIALGKSAGFTTKILGKAEITKLKMGGLLGVNKGSVDPPQFAIMEWKPANARNNKPYVLVGKGVVYDTGGNSLKTGSYMTTMKCDMGGAAAVIGTMHAVSQNKLPLHVIGLTPITDNRIGGNALVPDDVITISNGKTVEVLNTDAEGRLILADALVYAQKYSPKLVIDLATLTGAAANFTGILGSAMMGNASESEKSDLKKSGEVVFERLAEFPFWKEYGDMLKSKVADIKNIGGPIGGAMTAGKFLEHFTDYPWIHLDIAGPAFIDKDDAYKPAGGTGVGVRLLYNFLQNRSR